MAKDKTLKQEVEKAAEGDKYDTSYWSDEVSAAEKRLKQHYRKGDKIVERFVDYRGEDAGTEGHSSTFRLNLFNTHVSTMLAMLYGRVPKTEVTRRWEDPKDDAGRVAAEMLKRILNTSIQQPGAEFSDVLRACLQDRLLPGHGVARIRYTFETREEENPDYIADDLGEYPEDQDPKVEVTSDEDAPIDYIHWRDFLWGYGRLWKDVPWIAFKLYLDEEDAAERFGQPAADQLEFEEKKIAESGMLKDISKGVRKEAEILEIWCRKTRKVYFWSEGAKELLETADDPLGLRGFFPCPEPMIANPTTTIYRPTSDWQIAQDLYNEIDILQTRISIVTKAVKVVGLYDQSIPGIQRMLKEGTENDLIPVDNWAAFAEKGGLKGTVDWYPVADVVQALAQLKEMLRDTIELLYQVTGLSDILRGAAGPDRESAKSAGSRTKFASVRVQHVQDEFARFASDLMILRSQVITNHWEPEIIYMKSSAEFFLEDDQLKMEALELLKDKPQTWPWRIEIKPESIAMIDYAQLQEERTSFLAAMSTYIQSAGAMLKIAPEAAPLILEIMKWGLAGFKGAQQIEGLVDKTIDQAVKALASPKQDGDPKAQAEQQKSQAKMQEIQAKNQAKMQEQDAKHQQEMEKMFTEMQVDLKILDSETNASIVREKFQAHYNIMEKKVAERIQSNARAQTEKRRSTDV